MSEQEGWGDGAPKLASCDTVELSDSDPEDSTAPFDPEVEDLSSSGEGSSDGEPPGLQVSSGPSEPLFKLKGASAGFSTRSQSIFDGLESAAKQAVPALGEDNLIDGNFVRPPPPPVRQKAEGDIGRGPLGEVPPKPPSSSRGVPDYLAHPERWTKYSLEDVPETSNSKNSRVAHEYIQSLQQQKKGSWAVDIQEPFTPAFNQDHSSSSDRKIIFSKPGQGDDLHGTRKTDWAKKKEVGLLHLENLEEEENVAHPPRSEERRKRKLVTEKDESGEGEQQPAHVGFNFNRKINRKNFRRTAEKEEDF